MFDKRWPMLAFDTCLLGLDASAVIWMRLGRLAALDAAAMAEWNLMIREKVESAATLNLSALRGELGTTPHSVARRSIRHYRTAVAANRRRLSRSA